MDSESIQEFERDLKGYLYKLWSRLSSGSYVLPLVRAVEIPKKSEQGKVRVLACPRWRTALPKRSCACIWSRGWSGCSTPTHKAIDQGDRHCSP